MQAGGWLQRVVETGSIAKLPDALLQPVEHNGNAQDLARACACLPLALRTAANISRLTARRSAPRSRS